MTDNTIHNPDRYMVDLRQILSQGKKRVGLLIGAGAPAAIKIDTDGHVIPNGTPLIPDVARLTDEVVKNLGAPDQALIEQIKTNLKTELVKHPNIEAILTRVRRLAEAIGSETFQGLDGPAYSKLAE